MFCFLIINAKYFFMNVLRSDKYNSAQLHLVAMETLSNIRYARHVLASLIISFYNCALKLCSVCNEILQMTSFIFAIIIEFALIKLD